MLVVDDSRPARELLAEQLAQAGFSVECAADGTAAWAAFQRRPPHLVVSDVRMPEMDGLKLLSRIRSVSRTPVLLITAYGDVPTAVSAMQSGAVGFLRFPEDLDQLVPRARELAIPPDDPRCSLAAVVLGDSSGMVRVRDRLEGLASVNVHVLVEGPSGSGRSFLVDVLHQLGPARDHRLSVVDCRKPIGRALESATSLVLDHVDRLSRADQQVCLARLSAPKRGLARIYATAESSLSRLAALGQFDRALAEILEKFKLVVPSLSERTRDLPRLAEAFMERAALQLGRPGVRLSVGATERLVSHNWAGNLKELNAVIERLVAFCPGSSVGPKDVDQVLVEADGSVELRRAEAERRRRDELRALLAECGGNLAEVARRLGLTRGAVAYRARKYGLFRNRTLD